MASSQQAATFTLLTCDPIAYILIIDVCSSGKGYLVSMGPTISTTHSIHYPFVYCLSSHVHEAPVHDHLHFTLFLILIPTMPISLHHVPFIPIFQYLLYQFLSLTSTTHPTTHNPYFHSHAHDHFHLTPFF